MERLITVDKPDFVMGGFRTEGVFPMQEVAMNYKKLFFNCGAATRALQAKVVENYDRYKYFFKVTPFNEYYLVANDFKFLSMVGAIMKKELGITEPLRIAIVAEKLTWCDGIVTAAQANIPKMGMVVTGTWRPSDTATDVNAELTAIAATNPHIIFASFSGPVGVTFGKQAGEMRIPAPIVGIVVEAQKDGYWEATGGKGNYVMTMNTYAKGLIINEKTVPFVDKYIKQFGQCPSYTAATYDTLHMVKGIIEKAQSLDPDVLVPFIEKSEYISTVGVIKYYPVGPDTKAPACPHDIVYGPGAVTGIATQWQDGKNKPVWPAKGIGTGGFENLDYGGIVPYILPPIVIEKYKAK
jgi:branched-chain amino acid transport system substrate-binding protein